MQSLKTLKCTHTLLENNIILLKVKDDEVLETEDVKEMHAAHLQLSGGKPFAVLLDAQNHFTVTAGAREMIASAEIAEVLVASAFVVRSLASRITGNFYIRFNRPLNPTRLFTDEQKALAWLRKQMAKEKRNGAK